MFGIRYTFVVDVGVDVDLGFDVDMCFDFDDDLYLIWVMMLLLTYVLVLFSMLLWV